MQVRPLELPGWDPTARTWGEYRAWIEGEALPQALAAHRADTEATPDLQRTPAKKHPERDFQWLARWQILRETYRQILDHPSTPDELRESGEVDTVRRAVERAAADLIGLTRRTEDT